MQGFGVVAWMRLVRLFHRMEHVLVGHLRAADLSLAQFDVLTHVGAAEGLTQQELADRLLVTKGNICQLLDRMTERHLIARQADGRANRIYLTPIGRGLLDSIQTPHEILIEKQLGTLTCTERRELSRLLRKVERSLEAE